MAKANIQDVARLAGVSTATVSHTINATRFVSEASRKKVLSAIEQLGYQPDAFARSLRTGKKRIVGFVVPDISNPFFSTLIEEMEAVISEQNYHLLIANTRETAQSECDQLRFLSSGVVDGLVVASALDSGETMKKQLPPQFPVVLVDRYFEDAPFDAVYASSRQALYQGILKLVQDGHRKIGYILGQPYLSTTVERLQAYREALRDAGLPFEEDYVQYSTTLASSAFDCMDRLMEKDCSAIVVINSIMASNVVKYLDQHGLHGEKAVLGFCDYEDFFYSWSKQIDLIVQPVHELGKQIGKQILYRIEQPDAPCRQIIYNCTFVPKTQGP